MSSRLATKPSKKDRPKSSDKLRKGRKDGGTPEKPSTPNASDNQDEEIVPQIIMNDEILALQIKPEDLAQLREPHPPGEKKTSPKSTNVTVRKLKPASQWEQTKPKTVTITKPAPPDAPLAPLDYSSFAGARFTNDGDVVPHSILGSVEDYKQWARENGDLPDEMTESRPESQLGNLSVKYEKKKKQKGFPKFASVHESNALLNWQEKMLERKKQQGHLARLLDKPEEALVMNQSDSYRQTQELRYIVDRTIAHVDYGKGYRIGSEFWKQAEPIGDDLSGLHMTLTQTEKGYPPPMEHVRVADAIKKEKGTHFMSPRSPFHKPWHRTPYLAQRVQQLKPMINELDPHMPEATGLAIVGSSKPQEWDGRRPWTGSTKSGKKWPRRQTGPPTRQELEAAGALDDGTLDQEDGGSREASTQSTDPLADHPDVHPDPVFGPSILFAGLPARWTGDSNSFEGQVGMEARVTFEAFASKRTTSFLEISNDGTTSIYYDWKKIPKVNPFEMSNPKTQRFYFNTSHGVILPGDKMKFPFVFKSEIAGVFTEQWQLETSPVVCGGAALIVTLRGVALQEDKYKPHRSKIESDLQRRQAEQIVQRVLDELLEGIQSPERPCSPIDAHITEEERFRRINPAMHYDTDVITKMKECYKELFPEEERDEAPAWELSIDDLKQSLREQPFTGPLTEEEDPEEAENQFVLKKQGQLEFNNQCVQSMSFVPVSAKQLQMYTVTYDILCNLMDDMATSGAELRQNMGLPDRDDAPVTDLGTDPSDGKKGSKGGKDAKKGGAKDAKAGAKGKEKEIAVKSSKSGSKSRAMSREVRPASPTSSPETPSVTDPLTIAKFKEKLYATSHLMMEDAMDELAYVLGEVEAMQGPKQHAS